MNHFHSRTGDLMKLFSVCSISLIFLWACTTTAPPTNTETTMTEPPAEEVETGEDKPMEGTASDAPQDCVENDERAACQIKPRAGFLPEKFKSERFRGRCLRPRGGSTRENVEIILSTCSNSKSRYWLQKHGVYAGGNRLENLNSGKCIQRVGDRLLQRTCAGSGDAARNQTAVRLKSVKQ